MGEAQLAVESLKLAFDRDGDGLTDPIEDHGLRTGSGELVRTDATLADSDGDGLEDGAEVTRVDAANSSAPGGYYVLHSNPLAPDSDRDGVDDFDEQRVWDSFPFVADSDGDGYTDLVDPDVDTDSAPPVLRFRSRADDFSSQLTVVVSDSSDIESVTIKAEYVLSVPTSDNVSGSVVTETIEVDDRERINAATVAFGVVPPRSGALGTPPIGYVVNATDSEGNTISVHVTLNGSEDAKAIVVGSSVESHAGGAAAAGGLVFGTLEAEASIAGGVGVGSGATVSATGVGAALLVGIAAVVGFVAVESRQFAAREVLAGTAISTETLAGGKYAHVPPTGETPVLEFPSPISDGVELTLPSGRRYKAPVGRPQNPREWGWEQIKRLPGIQSPGEIQEILKTPGPFGEIGPYDIVIGDNPSGQGELLIRLLGGVVVSAETLDTYDPQGFENREAHLTEEQYREHILPHDKPLTRDEIERVVENADKVFQNDDGLIMWVLVENGVVKIVRGFDLQNVDEVDLDRIEINTAFKPERGLEYVRDFVKLKRMKQIYPDPAP